MRSSVLLQLMASRAASRESGRRKGSAPLVEPFTDLRRMWAVDVLPALRTRVLRAAAETLSERGEAPANRSWRGKGHRQRYFPRTGYFARRGWRGAPRPARRSAP